MPLIEIILMAMAVALDAFAVSLGVGTQRLAVSPRAVFRLAFHFGLFQFLMPVLGWSAGSTVAAQISAFDHWVVAGLLSWVGGRMIRSGVRPEQVAFPQDPSRGWTLVFLAVATSIDAFAVGLSLAMMQVSIWYPSVIIGVSTGGLSLVGLLVGYRLGVLFGKRMEVLGGLILVGIGLRVLLTHLCE